MRMNKKTLGVGLIFLLLAGCHQEGVNYYEKGYEDAWDGSKNYFEYYFEADYKKGYLDARSHIQDYRKVSSTMRSAQKDLNKAVDDISQSVEDLKKKVETWGKDQQPV